MKHKFVYSLIKILYLRHSHGDVAQLARVLDWQSRGRGFEPHRLHQIKLTDPRKFDTEPFLCFLRSVFFDHAMDYVRLKIHICINIHKHGCINNLKRLARGKR